MAGVNFIAEGTFSNGFRLEFAIKTRMNNSVNGPIDGMAAPIPLTLTLSHGEREQSAAASVAREVRRAETALGFAEGQRRILPLPEGEGRGEGKRDIRCANRVAPSTEVC